LHLVSLDVPYPPDYGGAMDIFYRIESLYRLGFKLTMHVFEYGRGKQEHLEKYGKVIYYGRSFSKLQLLSKTPFIVLSRKSDSLLKNLLLDTDPILFEGLHTTYFLSHPKLKERIKFVRTHNIEHEYYRQLASGTSSLFKKLFFLLESKKLNHFEENIKYANLILAIKPHDAEHFKKLNPNVTTLPASIPKELVNYQLTKKYALFHGNLSVIENENAVIWIYNTIKNSISDDFEFVVAGKNPSEELVDFCKENRLKLFTNPSIHKMNELIYDARIHVFHSKAESGVKLKLLQSINSCGHIITVKDLIFDSEIDQLCHVVNNEHDFNSIFLALMNQMLNQNEFDKRIEFLKSYFQIEAQVLGNMLNVGFNAS
jgi:hypothetical protein